jgi:prophage antirepressor-like protein
MNDLKIFNNDDFGKVRMMVRNDENWWIGKDIVDILEYQNGSRDIKRHVDTEDRETIFVHDGVQKRQMIVINESGLYSLILNSKLPKAKQFKRWITSEVIPSIRKTGAYMTSETIEKTINDPDFIIQLATQLKKEKEEKEKLENKNKQLEPKALIYDKTINSKGLMTIREAAQVLGTGQNRMFKWLGDNHYFFRDNGRWIPKQDYIDQKLFEVKTRSFKKMGEEKAYTRIYITSKGFGRIAKEMNKLIKAGV